MLLETPVMERSEGVKPLINGYARLHGSVTFVWSPRREHTKIPLINGYANTSRSVTIVCRGSGLKEADVLKKPSIT
jgi:hypothetical protein